MNRFIALLLSLLMVAGDAFAIDINGQLKNAQLERSASAPVTNVVESRIYYNTTDDKPAFYNGATWEAIVSATGTQTLTNKTLTSPTIATPVIDDYAEFNEESAPGTPSAGKVRVYAKSDKKLYKKGSDGVESAIGSGTGSGVYNSISNGDAEDGTTPTSYAVYDDGAVAAPVSGTGGSPSIITTWARNTTTPLQSTADWKLAKGSGDAQGEGWAIDFTIPKWMADSPGTRNLNFDLRTTSNYEAGDVRVYLYDVDTSTLITPQFITCGGGSTPALSAGPCPVRLSWLSSTSDDYRLIFHVATTETATYDLYLDNIFAGSAATTVGSGSGPVTTWPIQALKATTTSPTLSNNNAKYWRSGQWLNYDVQFSFTNANKGSGDYYLDLPTGLSVDTGVILSTDYPALGSGDITITSSGRVGLLQYDQASGRLKLSFADGSALLQFLDSGDISSGSMFIRLQGRIPILQWASGQTLGENTVEYACSSTGTWDAAAAAANTIYGPAGCPMSGALTASRAKVVQWQTPIDASDNIQLELTDQSDGTGWVTPAEFGTVSIRQSSTFYGVSSLKTSSTQSTATFQQYAAPSNATYAGTGSAWSSAWRWRMVKRRSGVAVPFGLATSSQPGLITREQETSTHITSTGHNPTVTVDFYFSRNGDQVVACWEAFNSGGTVGAGYFTFSTSTIPADYRPVADSYFSVPTIEGNLNKIGGVKFDSDGSVNFGATATDDTFNGTTANGANEGCVSWYIH